MRIFREYIGVKPYPDNLNDFPVEIINPKIHEFHFILGFATEQGTGDFYPNWNVDYFSPEKVEKLKKKYPNVKVVISIGGREPQYPFNPAENAAWVDNAITSLKAIIETYKYNIDGIDIHYEHIHSGILHFARYMGGVIVGLRQVQGIKVVSIAPSARVSIYYYRKLYQDYNAHIDWVDCQFYSQPVPNCDEFVNLYNQLSKDFDASKLLVGGSTDPDDAANMPRDVFIEGVSHLVQNVSSAFVWNANDSAASENHFALEETIQAILTGQI